MLFRSGFEASLTRGGHIRFTHPRAKMPVFTSFSASDHRANRNAIAMLRRVLEPEGARV